MNILSKSLVFVLVVLTMYFSITLIPTHAATTFSIDMTYPVIAEFGTYTSDSIAYSVIHGGLWNAIGVYAIFIIGLGAISLSRLIFYRLKKGQKTPTTPPAGFGPMNFLALAGPLALFILWRIVNLQKFEFSTLTYFTLAFEAVLFTILIFLEKYNRRRRLAAGKRWAITLWQCLPFVLVWMAVNIGSAAYF